MIIYIATNKINGKEYIGQTISNLGKRKSQHVNTATCKNNNSYFHKAIRKYGSDNFDWEILHDDITNIDDLNKLEIYYIGLYNTFNNGYNLNIGGRNAPVSKDTRAKMSISQTGEKNPMYGKLRSEETRRKISEGRIGKFKGKDNPTAVPVNIGNKHFDTLTAAAKFIGKTPAGTRYRILHKTKWLDYNYLEMSLF